MLARIGPSIILSKKSSFEKLITLRKKYKLTIRATRDKDNLGLRPIRVNIQILRLCKLSLNYKLRIIN